MATGKPFSGWLSGDLLKKAQKRVDDDYDGNISEYVVDLIRDDVDTHEPVMDAHTTQLTKLRSIAESTGLDAVSLVRATLAAVVSHAEANGGRIEFPIRLASVRDEVRDGADVWAHIDQSDRDCLLEHVSRGDPWHEVLNALKQETAPRLKDLRLAYIFATSVPSTVRKDSSTGADIPNSPVNQLLAAEQKRRAEQAAIRAAGTKPGQTGKGTRPKAQREEA